MATVDDVANIASGFPEVTVGSSYGNQAWTVCGKAFAWVRPFSKADLKRFGDETPPEGPIVAVKVEDLADKEAVLEAHATSCFTIAHFDSFPAVLVNLPDATIDELEELLEDGWLACASKQLVATHLADHRDD